MDAASHFASFPDDARLWVYAADAPLTKDDTAFLRRRIGSFLRDWSSHSRPVNGALHVHDHQFIMLAATLAEGDISGCGIDASVHVIDEVAKARRIDWIPSLHVIYRDDDGQVQHCTRGAFRSLAEQGVITADTSVLDPSITTLQALRSGQFEQRAGASWHAKAFNLRQAA
jgi:hypothetical protein